MVLFLLALNVDLQQGPALVLADLWVLCRKNLLGVRTRSARHLRLLPSDFPRNRWRQPQVFPVCERLFPTTTRRSMLFDKINKPSLPLLRQKWRMLLFPLVLLDDLH